MSSSARSIVVAIDGPSASGKSTVSRDVARDLQFIYVDSGALYRGMTWKMLREGVDVTDSQRVIEVMERTQWDFFVEDLVVRFTIDGEDPGQQIRSGPVRESVSDIAAIPEVSASAIIVGSLTAVSVCPNNSVASLMVQAIMGGWSW